MRTLFGTMVLLFALALGVQAALVKQPYLQNLMDTSIVVRWETQTAQTGRVQYGLTTAYGLEVNHSNSTTQHELRLPTLLRDTLYHYRAISGSDTSADAAFHTPVAVNRPFRFIAYGDNRSDSAAHQSVVDRMALVNPAPGFMVNVGDLTATGATSEYQTFFNVERGLLRRITMFPSLGNHDIANLGNWNTLFALPGNERWYSFRYGNSTFHCLDNYSPDTLGTPQYTWLVNELLADSADPGVRHIFVFWHEPPYTTNAGHSSNLRIRQYIDPLMERFRVRLTFQGHVHAYEHSYANGIHYITTGGGGAPLATVWNAPQPWTVYREATYEFVLVDVRGDTVYSRGIKPSGAVIDSFRLIAPGSGVAEAKGSALQLSLALKAVPNPFSKQLRVSFSLPRSERTRITVYSVSGKRVATLKEETLRAGEHEVFWDSGSTPNGFYFCILSTPEGSRVVPLTLLR